MGYFGAGNFGDDALLVDWLQANSSWLDHNGITCDVLSRSDSPLSAFLEAAQLEHLLGRCIESKEALRLDLSEYVGLVAPGGSLLQDTTSWRSLAYYLLLMRHFAKTGKPIYLLHQGIGPIVSLIGNWYAARILSRVTMLSVRDEQSMQWAERQRLLSRNPGLLLSADPILSASFAITQTPLPAQPYALVIPRPTGDLPHPGDPTTETQALVLACQELAACGLTPVLLALHPEQDAELCDAVASACPAAQRVVPVEPTGNATWTLIANSALVVSYRLHGLVSAAACGVPGFGVAYDPKVSALCDQLDFRWSFPAELHEPEALGALRMLALTLDNARARLVPLLDASRGRVAASRAMFRELFERHSLNRG